MNGVTSATARAFLRSLNILLKLARLYEFGHVRTGAQFDTTWKELRATLNESGGSGLLLGASGNQILLDGVPLGTAAGERSFAQLLASSGIASIHFGTSTTQPQFARFVRGFPSGNAKPTALAEQLKSALAGDTSIKINEIRYVAEDSSVAGIKMAANLTAKVLGAQGDKFKDFLEDPNKLLQMILAAESSRGPGGGGGGPGAGFGGTGGAGGGGGAATGAAGTLWDTGAGGGGGGAGSGGAGGAGSGGGSGSLGSSVHGSSAGPAGSGPAHGAPGRGGNAGVGGQGKWLTASALLHAGATGGTGVGTDLAGAPGGAAGAGGYAVAKWPARTMSGRCWHFSRN